MESNALFCMVSGFPWVGFLRDKKKKSDSLFCVPRNYVDMRWGASFRLWYCFAAVLWQFLVPRNYPEVSGGAWEKSSALTSPAGVLVPKNYVDVNWGASFWFKSSFANLFMASWCKELFLCELRSFIWIKVDRCHLLMRSWCHVEESCGASVRQKQCFSAVLRHFQATLSNSLLFAAGFRDQI